MSNSLYLVLDMINDLVHPDGANGKSGQGPMARSRNIIAKTKAAIAGARTAGVRVGYVRVGFSPDYKECPPNSPIFSRARDNGLFKLGTWGTEVHEELQPHAADFDIIKHRVSPFYGTNLEPIIRATGTTRLYLSGVSTNAVVQSAVREAHDRDLECIVLEDCCSAATPEEHEGAASLLARFGKFVSSEGLVFI